MTPERIIDSHQHVFWHGRNDAGLIADMDEHGIESAWLLSWEVPSAEDHPGYHGILNPLHQRDDGTHRGVPLTDLLLTREHYPDRFILGYCPHPATPGAPELLKSAVSIHGVQVCGEWKFRIPIDDPRSLELFHCAGELNLPVVLHLDVPYLQMEGKQVYQPLWYGGTVENLERALLACTETIFIGHAPGFWREISGDARSDASHYPRGDIKPGGRLYELFDRYPNLYADLSAHSARYALERDPLHATRFLTRFHDRLLFGRDIYGQDLHRCLQALDLPTHVAENIYYGNAQRLLSK